MRAAEKARANGYWARQSLARVDGEVARKVAECGAVPEGWHAIARRRDEPKRERVTVALEEDVVRFYRSMGRRYGDRMNEVLRAFMHARLAGLLAGAETVSGEAEAEGATVPVEPEAVEPAVPAEAEAPPQPAEAGSLPASISTAPWLASQGSGLIGSLSAPPALTSKWR